MFAYCNNNPVIFIDPTGESYSGQTKDQPLGLPEAFIAVYLFLVSIFTAFQTQNISAPNISFAEKSSLRTKTLSDTKAKKPTGRVYQLAYINDKGELKKFSKKYSFVEALQLLGFTNAQNTLDQEFKYNGGGQAKNMLKGYDKWGLYTKEKAHAKAIAVVFGCSENPEVHGSGNYGHYHDDNDPKKHHIHIWFGGVISY